MRTSPRLTAAIASAATLLGVPAGAVAIVDPTTVINSFAGNGSSSAGPAIGDGGPATSAVVDGPTAISRDTSRGILIAETRGHRIRRVSEDGSIATVAGTGTGGFSGDLLPATSAQLNSPEGVAGMPDGSILIADTNNNRIRQVLPLLGTITTVAGTGAAGAGGDGLPAAAAQLVSPTAVAPTWDGGYLVADQGNHRIRKVSAAGVITTVAGAGTAGFSGDGGPAAGAELNGPHDVVSTDDGGFLIADTGNHRIRRVSPSGVITTVAGEGTAGFSGDGGDPLLAKLNAPEGIDAKSNDAFLVADTGNHRVRKVKYGTIKTDSGTGTAGFSGDGGDGGAAELNGPTDVVEPNLDSRLIADHQNNRVRVVGTLDWSYLPPILAGLLPVTNPVNDKPAGGSSETAPHGVGLPAPVPPKVGQSFIVKNTKGEVKVKLPGRASFVALAGSASIPPNAVVSTERGRVALTAAKDGSGATQTATFAGGTFRVTQRVGPKPVTDLLMRGGDFRPCWRRAGAVTAGRASAAAYWRSRVRRRLWGSGHGRFRTRGRHGAATVRGTIWLTEDSCLGTRVSVRRGLVAVRDNATRKSLLVRKGRSFLAKAKRRR